MNGRQIQQQLQLDIANILQSNEWFRAAAEEASLHHLTHARAWSASTIPVLTSPAPISLRVQLEFMRPDDVAIGDAGTMYGASAKIVYPSGQMTGADARRLVSVLQRLIPLVEQINSMRWLTVS